MTAPDLRTTAMAVSTTWDQTWGKVGVAELENTMAPLIDTLRVAALAAEATEPPPCCAHPKDEHSYEGNPEADPRYEPMWCDHKDCPCPGWGMTGSAPNPQGADEPKRWTFDVNYEGGAQPTDYGTGTEWDGSYQWAIYDGSHEIDDVVLSGMADDDPTAVLAALVAEHNRAATGGVPDEPGDDLVAELITQIKARLAPAPEPSQDDRDLCASGECGGCFICWGPPIVMFSETDVVPLLAEVERLRAAGSPPPTPAPTRDDIDPIAEGTVLDAVHMVTGVVELIIEVPEAEYADHLGTEVEVREKRP